MTDGELIEIAFGEAQLAAGVGEVPVGAVLLLRDGRLFRGSNRTVSTGNPAAHAEFLAITEAAEALGDWRLEGSILACTLEPCLMCAGLSILARVDEIIYGAPDSRFGAFGSLIDASTLHGLNHYPRVRGPLDAGRCGGLLREFFKRVRRPGEAAETRLI